MTPDKVAIVTLLSEPSFWEVISGHWKATIGAAPK